MTKILNSSMVAGLSEGRIILENDDFSKSEQILNAAFPNCPKFIGKSQYYFKNVLNSVPGYIGINDLDLFIHNLKGAEIPKTIIKATDFFTYAYGTPILVRDDADDSWEEAIFLSYAPGAEYSYIVFTKEDPSISTNNSGFSPHGSCYRFAKDVPQFVYLTAKDISEGKGVGIDPALIKFKD